MSTYVLGTHTSHDCSACLLKDGAIVAAIEKERITKTKHDGGNDNAVVHYCLKAAGIKLRDVALVVQNANFDMFERRHVLGREAPRIVENAARVVTISHHLAHMFSAVATAPFDDMAVLVIDGCGNCFADCVDKAGAAIPERPANADLEQIYFEKDSYYEHAGGRWRTVFKDFSPFGPRQGYSMYPSTTMHSIGGAYSGVSTYVFRGVEDPGKLMGLAPYGRPGAVRGEMFSLRDGRVFLDYEWMKGFDRPALDYADFKANFQYYADIAYWAQKEIERAILYVVDSRHALCPSDNLAYAGGVALNAVANRLIRTRSKFKNVYIQPAAGDNGLAIGCAYYGWLEVLRGKRRRHRGTSNFGRRYSSREIGEILAKNSQRLAYSESADALGAAAQLLVDGKVIGWFEGASEFGPRALGHRSVLALPAAEGVRDFINARIKFREDFRPFAPSVPAEDVSRYFEQDYASPYMIMVAPTREEWKQRIPAVVHRDGTARVQTVHRELSPRYYELHRAVQRLGGLPVLLNTSMNKRGMPIAETPSDAVALFLETALDALVLDDWIVLKKDALAKPDASPNLRDLLERACQGAALDQANWKGVGVLQLVVSGVDTVWTIDFTRSPTATERGAATADFTVETSWDIIRQLARDPAKVWAFYESGAIRIPGLGGAAHPRIARSVCSRIASLIALSGTQPEAQPEAQPVTPPMTQAGAQPGTQLPSVVV